MLDERSRLIQERAEQVLLEREVVHLNPADLLPVHITIKYPPGHKPMMVHYENDPGREPITRLRGVGFNASI